jgi:multiple sugar transport system substrate-binding protein
MKKLFSLISLVVVLAMLVTACGSAPATQAPAATSAPSDATAPAATEAPANPNAIEIRWFCCVGTGDDPAQQEIEKKVVEDFNASHPNIHLTIEIVTYKSAFDTLATEVASGNPPDIVGPAGVSGAEAFHGLWLDLTDLIKSNNYDLTQYDQGAINFYKTGGEGQIGLPFATYPSALFFDRDMFDEAKLPYPPQKYGDKYTWPDGTVDEWNYDTLRKVAMKLTVDENGKDATDPAFDPTKIVQYGYEPEYQGLREIGSFWGADSFLASDGKTAQVPDQWAAAWKWTYDGVWKDHFIVNDATRNSDTFQKGNAYDSGKVAMGISYLWYTCCLSDAGKNWDVAVVPSYNGKTTANFNADTFRIFKTTKHPQEAFEVLSYLLGDASKTLLDTYGAFPARTADQAGYLKSLDEKFPQKVDWQVFFDGVQYADNPSFEAYMPNLQEANDRATTMLSLMMTTENLDMDKEIGTLKSDLQTIFDKKK